MGENNSNKIETIANALLQVSDRVVEVSRDHVITRLWDAGDKGINSLGKPLGKKISDLRNDIIITQCDQKIEEVFVTGKNYYVEYTTSNDSGIITYSIRILAIHPDKEFLFVVVKNLSAKEGTHIIEDKWKMALDAAGDGMWDSNLETGNIFFSEKWHELFGYDASEVPTGADWGAKIHPDDLAIAQKKSAEYMEGKTPSYVAEMRYLCKDGTYKWILSRGVIVSRTTGGKPLRFIGTHTDINERKLEEEKYQSNAQLLATLLGSLKDGIIVTNEAGTVIFANQAICDIYGIKVSPEQLIGTDTAGNLQVRKTSFNDPERFVSKTLEMLNSNEVILNEEWGLKNGKILSRDYIPVFLSNEKRIGLWKLTDITDREKAIEALKISKETFASAFDYSGIGIALLAPSGKWLDVNKVICELTGYTKEELLELSYHDITYIDDKEVDRPLINQMLQKEITTYTIEKRYVSKKQKIVLVSLTVSLVWNSDDTPNFFIAQVVDITKKKELENEIYRKNAELEATRVSLINKINQLEELSHIIAHNLRGPAGNIHMLAEALVAKGKGGADANANPLSKAFSNEEALGFIKESSTALLNSLTTLMEIAEIKLNKDVPYNDCDVPAIIDDIMAQLHGVIYEKRAVITSDILVKHINYPQAYLESILYNFISNALKYSFAEKAPQIMITTKMHEGKVQVVVKDNGIGIDMEKYGDKVFKLNQVFHQGYDSKGVGLYITKTQVESFGGTIEVRSAPNEGSEFIVTL